MYSVKKNNSLIKNTDFSPNTKEVSTLGLTGAAAAGAGRFLCARPESR